MAVIGLLAGALASPAHAAPVRSNGLVSDLTWYISRADMDRSIALMQDAHVSWIRANLNWSAIEPNAKGSLDAWWLGEIDYAVAKAQAAGIQILMPIADGVPYWASADPGRSHDSNGDHWNKYWKPSNYNDYADFASAMVTRYKAKGVHAYEVWNEPNYSRFWPSGPSAADYTAMLKAAYPAIKVADPSSTVVMGGLSRNDYGFLKSMYAAGAKPYFDAAAVHPYTKSVDPTQCWNDSGTTTRSIDAFCGIESVHDVMVSNGDSAKDLWLTEFGWSTASGSGNGVSEADQATFLTKSFNKLNDYPYVTHAFWYALRNNYWSNNDQSDVEANYGLARVDFSLKPAYTAFKALSTTDATAPTVSTIAVVNTSRTSVKVNWTTNEPASGVVEFWKTGGTIRRASNAALVTAHSQTVTALSSNTLYNYRVKSTDAAGNLRTSATSTFRTLP